MEIIYIILLIAGFIILTSQLTFIIRLLFRILKKLPKKIKKLHLVFYAITNDSTTNKKEITMLPLKKTQKQLIAVEALDGETPPNVAPLENVVFTSLDEAVCTVEVDPENPKQAWVKGVADGVTQVHVTGDADLGEGELPIEGFISVEVQTIFGATIGINPIGEPVEQ